MLPIGLGLEKKVVSWAVSLSLSSVVTLLSGCDLCEYLQNSVTSVTVTRPTGVQSFVSFVDGPAIINSSLQCVLTNI